MKKNDLFLLLGFAALIYFLNKKEKLVIKEAQEPQKISGFSDNIGIY